MAALRKNAGVLAAEILEPRHLYKVIGQIISLPPNEVSIRFKEKV